MYVVGFDIGGTKSAVLIAKIAQGKVDFLSRSQICTEGSWQSVLDRLCEIYERQLALLELSKQDISAAGVSCGGPLNSGKGLILSPPNLPGWDNAPVCAYLGERLGVPVRLMNDADACAVAEWKFGAGAGKKNMIFLTFGTGLGAGLILNGALYSGTNDMAGEVGHVRLEKDGPVGYNKAGSFESFCSGAGIRQIAQKYAAKCLNHGDSVSFCRDADFIPKIDAKRVIECAEEGHEDAIAILRETGAYFGKGLAILVDILNPELIVAGSVFVRAHKFLYDSAMETLKTEALGASLSVCRLAPAMLGEKIGDYAAVVAATRGQDEII